MNAGIEKNKILLSFNYDPQLISLIKNINGREWDPIRKVWSIPINDSNIEYIEKVGFDTSVIKKELIMIQNEKEATFNFLKKEIKEQFPFLFDYQLDAVAKAINNKNLLIADDTGLGKCERGDTIVYIDDILVRLDDIWKLYHTHEEFDGIGYWSTPNKSIYVYSLDNNGKIVRKKVSKIYRQYIKENIDKVVLRDGNILYKTKSHKLLDEKLEWNVVPKRFICVPSILPEGNKSDITEDFAKLLAWQIAEGYENIDNNTVSITQWLREDDNYDILAELNIILNNMGYKPHIHEYNNYKSGKYSRYISFTSKLYVDRLYYKGYKFGMKSKDKVIPDSILNSDNNILKVFIQNFFDAESCANSDSGIDITSASEKLIKQLVYILRKFGIWMTISKGLKCASNTEDKIKREYWRGSICGDEARKFLSKIGFRYNYKQKKLMEHCDKKSNTNIDRIYVKDIIEDMYNRGLMSQRGMGLKSVYFGDTNQCPSRSKTEDIIYNFQEKFIPSGKRQKFLSLSLNTPDIYIDVLKKRLNTNVFYCDIKSIEEEYYEGWVYDLEIEDTHNFIAECMICHNTIMSGAIMKYHISKGHITRICIVCPASIKWQWQDEMRKWFDMNFVIVEGTTYKREKIWEKQPNFIIVNYEMLIMERGKGNKKQDGFDFKYIYDITKGQGVIFDEASFLKNEKSKRTLSAASLEPKYKLALTGTPVETKLKDAFIIGNIIDEDWMNWKEFSNTYCVWDNRGYGSYVSGYTNVDKFMKRLMQIGIRRKKEDVKEMPGKVTYNRLIPLGKNQLSMEKVIKGEILKDYENAIKMSKVPDETNLYVDNVLTRFVFLQMLGDSSELLELSDAFKLYIKMKVIIESSKLKELLIVIEELSDKKIVIFSRFKKMIPIIKKEIEKAGFGECILGSGDTLDRRQLIEDFKNKYRFLVVTDAFSYGIDMPFATTVINFDMLWNPAKMLQREGRIYRITSKEQVKVINLISEGIESYMFVKIQERAKLADAATSFDLKKQLLSYLMK